MTATQAPRILKPRVAYDMADILRDVVQRGTAVRAKVLGRTDIGGKTGTTNDAKDAWFAGFHPTNATVVWIGFDQPSTLGRREYGGVAALPVWIDFMRPQLKNVPFQWVSVDNKSKSKKQKQQIIEMTDDGIITTDDDESDSNDNQPIMPKAQQRNSPEPVARPETRAQASSSSNSIDSDDTASQNPLTVTPAERIPAMPE